MKKTDFNDDSYTIIGAYYEVFNNTSRIFPEHIFAGAMMAEVRSWGVSVTRPDQYEIIYKNGIVGRQQLDLFIGGEIVVENKVVNKLTRLHKAQCISYLKTVGKQTGLLLNFGGPKPEFYRLYFDPAKKPSKLSQDNIVIPSADWLYPDLASEQNFQNERIRCCSICA